MEIVVDNIRMRSSTKHPNYYFSEDGQHCYSLQRKHGQFITIKEVEGYMKVNYVDGKRNIGVHILVWEAWNGLIPKGYQIHHQDKCPKNNHISNLVCLSPKEHLDLHRDDQQSKKRRHESRLGRASGMLGKKHSQATIEKMKQKAGLRKKDSKGRFII